MEKNKKRYDDKKAYNKKRENNGKRDTERNEAPEGLVVGRNAVRELLKSGRTIDKIYVQRGEREGSIVVLVAEAVERKIPIIETDRAKLDKMTNFAVHQGVAAMAAEKEYCSVEDILEIAKERNEKPFVIIADGITLALTEKLHQS